MIGSGYGLMLIRWQAITWTNVGRDAWRSKASLEFLDQGFYLKRDKSSYLKILWSLGIGGLDAIIWLWDFTIDLPVSSISVMTLIISSGTSLNKLILT